MATKIQIKRGTKTNLPTLSPGEFGLTTDTEELYIGSNNGNIRMGKNGESSTPNATATHSGSVVAITAPAGVNLISFYAPSDFSGDDTYTVNGSAVTLTDLNGNAIYSGWKEGAPVQLILKGTQAFFKSGGGVNGDLPPLNPNMTGELADGVFTVTADKLPVAQADALAGAEWYYADHVPARPGDGTKVEFTREQLIEDASGVQTLANTTNLGDEAAGSTVTLMENGEATEFLVLQHGYPVSGNGNTLLRRKDAVAQMAWDSNGVNAYSDASADKYLSTDYIGRFTNTMQSMLQTVNISSAAGNGNTTVNTIPRKAFILSYTEAGFSTHANAPAEGTAIPYFDSDAKRIVQLNGVAVNQWLRTPYGSSTTNAWIILNTGAASSGAVTGQYGIAPCIVLKSDTQVNPDGSIVESDNSPTVTLSIPWTESGYCYCRQFPYNSKHQYQTQLIGAVATNDPAYVFSLDRVLENNSWDKIAEASESGIAADVWQVGDTKDIVVGGETLTVEIVGFDHDDLADGSGKAGITFGMKNLMANDRRMNSSKTNAGGFTGSDMYDWMLGTLLNSLPSDLRAVLKSVNKKTSAGNQSSTINTNAMKIFLFSEIEIFGSVMRSKAGEGSQYSRFATASSRIKYLSNGSGSTNLWWERSPTGDSSSSFCVVNSSGEDGEVSANLWGSVCFGFCV